MPWPTLAEVCLSIYDAGVCKVDATVIGLTVLSSSAVLPVEFARNVFVLSNSSWETLCFADVGGRALCTWNWIQSTPHFFSGEKIFWSWHYTSKCWYQLVGHPDTFFCLCTCQRFASLLNEGNAYAGIWVELRAILWLKVSTIAILTLGDTTDKTGGVAVLLLIGDDFSFCSFGPSLISRCSSLWTTGS